MKDDKKIFLGIVVVTALLIIIIGGTFAFFSASGGSENGAIGANSAVLADLGFASNHSKIATDLIPVASQNPYFYRYPGIAASGDHSCLDDVGNEICSVYEFTITNTASVAQTIYVSLVPSENTFDNLYFAAFNTTIASADYTVATGSSGSGETFTLIPETTSGNSTLGHQATKLTKNSTNPIDMPGLSTSLDAGESITYTVLIWLQETSNNQNTEQGGSFKAGINVTTGSNSTGVTGIMEDSSYTYVYVTYDGFPYTTASAAIANNNDTPIYLKHKVVNPTYETVWCIISNQEEYNSCNNNEVYSLETECNQSLQSWNPGSDFTCESQQMVSGGSYLESYVEFIITPETASANPGMIAGTYSLRGRDGGTAYSENVNTITTAYGSSRCTEENNGYRCSISQYNFAFVDNEGYVDVFTGAYACIIRTNGEDPYCYWD